MLHHLPINDYGPQGPAMGEAITKCVHCGFCLPVCPTYQVMGEEMDSPRGRIFLMKDVLEGRLELDEATRYIDRCLGCLACVTACPSGVQYGELITPFRSFAEGKRRRRLFDRLLRRMVLETLPYPGRFRFSTRLGQAGRMFRLFMPRRMRNMLKLLPARLPPAETLPEITPAIGRRRGRVALLAGCAQQVLAPEVNRATIRVLSHNGVEVVIPRDQTCCGALAAHTGAAWQANAFARRDLRAFPTDVDAVLTNAAGCGSGMHEYPLWLKGEPEEAAAERLARSVKDVSLFLHELGVAAPRPLDKPTRVAYHDACHLAHGQGVTRAPRALLGAIPNLELVEIPGGGVCCGSAGTYNLEQPETAAELGRRKVEAIRSVEPDAVATGNIGCIIQIRNYLAAAGCDLPVYHTVELLDRAYGAG